MGTPLDLAAGAAGFASLGIMLFQGCVKGFMLLSTAQNFGKDADLARCEIEFQQYRLFQWAEQVGLNKGLPNRSLNWEIVSEQLKQLESLLTGTSKFQTEYGLEIVTTDEEVLPENLEAPKTKLQRLLAHARPDFHNESARTLQKGVTIWKRLKWATIDKTGLSMLISDIQHSVENLHVLLQDSDNQLLQHAMRAVLRHLISQETEPIELSKIEQLLDRKDGPRPKNEDSAVVRACRMKKKMVGLEYGEQSGVAVTSVYQAAVANSVPTGNQRSAHTRASKSRKPLSFGLLKRSSKIQGNAREMATYNEKRVLLEWKSVEQGVESKLKHRIKSLAALLEDVKSPSFHSLNCLGYLKDSTTGSYAYIFQPPSDEWSEFTSLSEVLHDCEILPSLDDRMALATALVETVLELHTSGWLHKGIRSDNIIFFRSTSICITYPYVEGYEFARADNPSDMTESPTLQQEANIYRHPALLKPNRPSFCKSYDLYGLGCVLIEIGLWQDLTSVLLHRYRMKTMGQKGPMERLPLVTTTYADKAEAVELSKAKSVLLAEDGPGSIMEALNFFAGKKFAGIVRLCLSAAEQSRRSFESDEDEEDEMENDGHCLDLELEILRKLQEHNL